MPATMKQRTKNTIQALVGLLIAGFFLFLTLRDKPLDTVWKQVQRADVYFILLNGVCLYITFLLRALRWKVLMQNMGYHPRRREVVHATIIGYFVNSFTPKLGEIARCTTLSQSSAVPVSRALGSVVSERVYDVLVLFLGLILIFILEFQRLWSFMHSLLPDADTVLAGFSWRWVVAFIAIVAVVAVFIFLSGKILRRVRQFVDEMIQGFRQSFRIRRYPQFLLLTAAIWAVLILMNWVSLKALPSTSSSDLYFAVVVLFVGGIGWALPAPGGIGTTHFFILQLFLVFGFSSEAGIGYGILSNGLTFLYTLLIGGVAVPLWYFRVRKGQATWSDLK